MSIFKQIPLLLLLFGTLWAQEAPVDVCDKIVKIPGMHYEKMYFAFSAGDKIIFSFEEKTGKDIKEVDIIEYPSTSRFSDFKASKIEQKTIDVSTTGIYLFKFKNTSMKKRICKIHIQRIPKNDYSRGFNTKVEWVDKIDTTWKTYTKTVKVGEDTTVKIKTVNDLVRSETKELMFLDKEQWVHSRTNSGSNRANVCFSIPPTTTSANTRSYPTQWIYWFGVDDAGRQNWNTNVQTISKFLVQGAVFTSPLGALAAGAVTNLITSKTGEYIKYTVRHNGVTVDMGKASTAYKLFFNPLQMSGEWCIDFENTNMMVGVEVKVRVSAMMKTDYYQERNIEKFDTKAIKGDKEFKEPIITRTKVPIYEGMSQP